MMTIECALTGIAHRSTEHLLAVRSLRMAQYPLPGCVLNE